MNEMLDDPLDECLTEMSDWLIRQKHLSRSLEKGLREFLGQKRKKEVRVGEEQIVPLAQEYVMFDYRFPNGKTGLEMYLEASRKTLSPDRLAEVENFKRQRFSLFKVVEQFPGKLIEVKDIGSEEMYQVQLRGAEMETDSCFIARLLPFRGTWVISSAAMLFHKDFSYTLERSFRRLCKKNADVKMTAKDIRGLMDGGKDSLWRTGSYERAELELDRLIRRWKVSGLTVSDIEREIRMEFDKSDGDVTAVVNKILRHAKSPKEKDLNSLTGILVRLWNEMPHNELGGKSPEKAALAGAMERQMMQDLMDLIVSEVDPEAMPDEEKRQKVIDALVQDWLHTPQAELSNRSPWQVMLDERERLGNPNREFAYKIRPQEIHFGPMAEGGDANENYSMALKYHKQGSYALAIEFYKNALRRISKKDPEIFRIYGNIGTAYMLLGKKTLAKEYFEKALKINLHYPMAKNHLALLKTKTSEELSEQGIHQRLLAQKDTIPPEMYSHWEPEKIEKLSSEEIAKRLSQWIPGFSIDGFKAKAEEHVSSEILAEKEYYPIANVTDKDEDFIWIACEILWQRLLPERPSAEMLVDELEERVKQKDIVANRRRQYRKKKLLTDISDGILQWLMVHPIWRILQEPSKRQELWKTFKGCGAPSAMSHIEACFEDLYMNNRHQSVIEFVDRMNQMVGNEPDLLVYKADSLIALGKKEEGQSLYKKLTDMNPDKPWLLYRYGAMLLVFDPQQPEKAREILEQTLKRADKIVNPWEQRSLIDTVYEELTELAVVMDDKRLLNHYQTTHARQVRALEGKQVKKMAEFDKVVEKATEEQKSREGDRKALPYAEKQKTGQTHNKKVGRNDPCPCGSGKKYKKCCGR